MSNRSIRKVLADSAQHVTGIITNVETEKPIASLTFDDGPDPVYTPKILKLLKSYDIRATFFMVGEGARDYQDIVKKVAADGHAIGNHSYNHLAFPRVSLLKQREQIRKCQRALKPFGLPLFRPPYGMNTNRSNIGVLLQGYMSIGWSLDSQDWYEPNSNVMVDNLLKNTKPGSIILLHDRIFDKDPCKPEITIKHKIKIDREPMLSALNKFIEMFKSNIKFVTIPVLLQNGRPMRKSL